MTYVPLGVSAGIVGPTMKWPRPSVTAVASCGPPGRPCQHDLDRLVRRDLVAGDDDDAAGIDPGWLERDPGEAVMAEADAGRGEGHQRRHGHDAGERHGRDTTVLPDRSTGSTVHVFVPCHRAWLVRETEPMSGSSAARMAPCRWCRRIDPAVGCGLDDRRDRRVRRHVVGKESPRGCPGWSSGWRRSDSRRRRSR